MLALGYVAAASAFMSGKPRMPQLQSFAMSLSCNHCCCVGLGLTLSVSPTASSAGDESSVR